MKKIDKENRWRTLDEFSVASIAGNEYRAMERVAAAVRALQLPTSHLDRIKTAVAEAVMNAIEHGNQSQADLPVHVRLAASQTALCVCVTDCGGNRPFPEPEEPDLMAKVAGLQSPRGWGLFLIRKLMDEVRISGDGAHHTIELILMLDGAGHSGQAP